MRWFTWFVAFGIVWRGSIDLRNFRLLRLFFQGLFAFVFIRKLWCSLYIQLRWYPFALQRSHWRCLGFVLAVAKRGWSKNGSSYQQRLRGGRVEQHQWLNSSTANSCKDSSSDVAFEATDQTLHGTRPIARLKNCSTSQILSYSYQSYHAVRLHRWLLWLPKHRNNLAPMPHAGSKSTPQSVFETSFIILPWLRMGNTFIPLKVMKVCWMVPGRSVILRDQHLASRVDDCHCRRRPWMKVRKSEMHKDGFSTSFNSTEFLWFWKWSSQCCKYLTWHARHVTFVRRPPRLDPMDPDVFEKWPVRTETRETRYWCNGNECHQIRTYNLLQFTTTLRQDWQDEWFLLLWTINPWSLGSLLVFIFVEVHRCPLLSAELSRTRTWRKPHPM